MRRWGLAVAAMGILALSAASSSAAMVQKKDVKVPDESKVCVDCHQKEKVAATAIEEWRYSTHAREGVGCIDCHAAKKEDK
ncbi:MAG: multiheme c-type cytochrome, partial [Candidatus Deferrimicrobiaceae bacterium]